MCESQVNSPRTPCGTTVVENPWGWLSTVIHMCETIGNTRVIGVVCGVIHRLSTVVHNLSTGYPPGMAGYPHIRCRFHTITHSICETHRNRYVVDKSPHELSTQHNCWKINDFGGYPRWISTVIHQLCTGYPQVIHTLFHICGKLHRCDLSNRCDGRFPFRVLLFSDASSLRRRILRKCMLTMAQAGRGEIGIGNRGHKSGLGASRLAGSRQEAETGA